MSTVKRHPITHPKVVRNPGIPHPKSYRWLHWTSILYRALLALAPLTLRLSLCPSMSKRLSGLTSTPEKLGDVEAQSSASSPYSRTPTILGDDAPSSDGQEKRILPRRDSSSSTLAQDARTEAKSEARNEAAARRRVGGDGDGDGDLDSNVTHDQVPEKVNAYQVDWDGPDDPENPQNWSRSSRWYYTLLGSLLVFNATFASSSPGGIAVKVMKEFTFSTEIATLMISLFVGGYCVGPLFWGPLARYMVGSRSSSYLSSLYVGFQIGCALSPNTAAILSASPPPFTHPFMVV